MNERLTARGGRREGREQVGEGVVVLVLPDQVKHVAVAERPGRRGGRRGGGGGVCGGWGGVIGGWGLVSWFDGGVGWGMRLWGGGGGVVRGRGRGRCGCVCVGVCVSRVVGWMVGWCGARGGLEDAWMGFEVEIEDEEGIGKVKKGAFTGGGGAAAAAGVCAAAAGLSLVEEGGLLQPRQLPLQRLGGVGGRGGDKWMD